MSRRDYYTEATKSAKAQVTLGRLAVTYLVIGFLVFGWEWNHTKPGMEESRRGYPDAFLTMDWTMGAVAAGVFWPIVFVANVAIWVTR